MADEEAQNNSANVSAEPTPETEETSPEMEMAQTVVPGNIVAPSPHLTDLSVTTKGMMLDVLIGLMPVVMMSLYVFGLYTVIQVGLCVITALIAESVFTKMIGKPIPVGDYSAIITGVILGLSLPWSAPWYVPVIGSVVAVGLG